MSLKKRINKLEESISKTYVDAGLETELIEWFRSHPGYLVFAQPESNHGVIMPEHLSQAFECIINRTFAEKNLKPTSCNLLKILDSLSETFKGYATL